MLNLSPVPDLWSSPPMTENGRMDEYTRLPQTATARSACNTPSRLTSLLIFSQQEGLNMSIVPDCDRGQVPKTAESIESYKHKYAKQVLTGWIRSAAESVGYDKHCQLWGLGWRVNRKAPTWGVYEEYPICKPVRSSNSTVYAWDETDWGKVPTYDDLVAAGHRPWAILDVAIQHKGFIVYGFEVSHKNPVSDRKADYLHTLDFPVYELDAEWIMRQVKCPEKLAIARVFGGGL